MYNDPFLFITNIHRHHRNLIMHLCYIEKIRILKWPLTTKNLGPYNNKYK